MTASLPSLTGARGAALIRADLLRARPLSVLRDVIADEIGVAFVSLLDAIVTEEAPEKIGGVYGRNVNATTNGAATPLEHPVVVAIAQAHAKTPAQVVLRWHLEHGFSAIPKSVHDTRIRENFDVFDFALSADEVSRIDALDTGVRAGSDPEKFTAAIANFRKAVNASVDLAGKDLDGAKAAFKTINEGCNGCHEQYQLKKG